MGSIPGRVYASRFADMGSALLWVSELSPVPNQFSSAKGSSSGTVGPARSIASENNRLYDLNFALVLVSQIFFTLANNLMAHYSRWIDFLGGTVERIGVIMGVGSVIGLLLRPWMSELINQFGARTVWVCGHVLFAVGSIGSLLLHELDWAVYLCRASLILGTGFAFTSSLTYITQTSSISRRTEAIGIIGGGGFIGMLVGPYLGDLILGVGDRTRGDFTTLFVAAALSVILTALLVFFLRSPQTSRRRVPIRLWPTTGTRIEFWPTTINASKFGLRAFLSVPLSLLQFVRTTRRFWPGMVVIAGFSFGLCTTVPFVFLANYVDVTGLHGSGGSSLGLFFLGYGAWGLIVRVMLRQLPDRRGRRKVLIVGLAFMGLGMFSFGLVDASRPWMTIVPGLICGTGHALTYYTIAALTMDRFPVEYHGTGSTLTLMTIDTGMIAGAPPLGYIAGIYGYGVMFATIGTVCFIAAGLYAWVSVPIWRERRRERLAREAGPAMTDA